MTTRARPRGCAAPLWLLLLLLPSRAGAADPSQGGALAQSLAVAEAEEPSPDAAAVSPAPGAASAERPVIADYPELSSAAQSRRAIRLLPLTSRISLLPFVAEHVPGVQLGGGGLRIHGGQPRETQLVLDGARVRQLRIPLVAVAGLEVLTAGYGAEYADITGGVVALSTGDAPRRLAMSLELFTEGGGPVNNGLAAAVAAPLGDQLSVRAALQVAGASPSVQGDPEGIVAAAEDLSVRQGSAMLKLTWRPARQQRLHLLAAGALHRQDRVEDVDRMPEAQPRFDDRWLFTSLRWQGGLGGRTQAGAHVSLERGDLDELPLRCAGGGACDTEPFINRFPRRFLAGNHTVVRSDRRTSVDVTGTLDWQLPGRWSWLNAWLRFRPHFRTDTLDIDRRTPGDVLTEYVAGVPDSRTYFYSNNPLYEAGQLGPATFRATSRQIGASLEAPVVLRSRLHLVPGAAVVSAKAETSPGAQLADSALVPILRLAWQPVGGRDLWLRASTSRRADMELQTIIERSQSFPISRRCLWDPVAGDFTRECTLSGATPTTVGLRCGPLGLNPDGTTCRAAARVPRLWEHTLGVEGAIAGGLRAGVSLVERRTAGGWDLAETNRIWTATGTNIVGYRNGRAQQVLDLSANGDRPRRHRGATVTLAERAGPFALEAAYSWMRTEEDHMDAGRAVTLSDGGRSFVHLRAGLDLRHVIVGLLYSYAQGDQYNEPVRTYGSPWDGLRARVGVDPGLTLNEPVDRRGLRLPSLKQLHLHLRARGKRLFGVAADVFVDGVELLERDPTATLDPNGALGLAPPVERWWRLGVELRF